MKRNLVGILSLVVMSVMISATANAQAAAKANVPFAFKAGSKQLPPGTYVINRENSPMGVISLHNRETSAGALLLVQREAPGKTAGKLIFRHVADQYFLAQVWTEDGVGMTIPASTQEKALEKELRMASGKSQVGEEILIALN
jgi:hypothetical protein